MLAIPLAARASPASITEQVREALQDVEAVVVMPAFRALLAEMNRLPPKDRSAFVDSVVLNHKERAKRGVMVPDDMIIQRTIFADGRPTLFCVTKHLPIGNPWKKVTVTFDNTPK
jgi:hypothetical protein